MSRREYTRVCTKFSFAEERSARGSANSSFRMKMRNEGTMERVACVKATDVKRQRHGLSSDRRGSVKRAKIPHPYRILRSTSARRTEAAPLSFTFTAIMHRAAFSLSVLSTIELLLSRDCKCDRNVHENRTRFSRMITRVAMRQFIFFAVASGSS